MTTAAHNFPCRSHHAPRSNAATLSARPRALLILMAVLALGGMAHADATVEEPFNYPEGGLNDGTAATGSGLSGNWTAAPGGTIIPGLSYTGLPVANNALRSAGSRQSVSFANPLSSGTKWIGFLYKTSPGNPGANTNGVFFPNSNATCLWFGFGLAPYSGTQGELGLGSMTTAGTAAVPANSLQLAGLGTYGTTYLVVLKIDFDTAGSNDTVTVYLNPATRQAAPEVVAAATHGAFDVGTISGVGLNVRGAGEITVDEIRVGDTYSDAVGFINIPPDAPAGLDIVAGANAVTLSWTAPAGKPTSYNILRSTISGSDYETIGTTSAPTVTFTDSVLGGQTYFYVVTAVNESGESGQSEPASAEPILAPPTAPSGLAADAGDAQVSLIWTASPFATGYIVKVAAAAEGPYSTIGSTLAPTASYLHSDGLTNGTTYYYVVSATGAGGEGVDSAPIEATPVAPPPLVGSIEPGVGIRWLAETGVVYQVQWASELLEDDTVWHNLGKKVTGDGTTMTVVETVGPPHNFYRVLSFQ